MKAAENKGRRKGEGAPPPTRPDCRPGPARCWPAGSAPSRAGTCAGHQLAAASAHTNFATGMPRCRAFQTPLNQMQLGQENKVCGGLLRCASGGNGLHCHGGASKETQAAGSFVWKMVTISLYRCTPVVDAVGRVAVGRANDAQEGGAVQRDVHRQDSVALCPRHAQPKVAHL